MVFQWLKNKIPHRSVVKMRQNDDILIVCANSLTIYYFNSTAAFFLNSVDGKATVEDIKNKFLQKYEVDEVMLENDFVDMIRDLQWKEILTLEG
ncbi:MAG: PqqD family protein [Selenomonadaceae bacterium]|nr:PqqD family protein [Selenomonadaceae bacterium]